MENYVQVLMITEVWKQKQAGRWFLRSLPPGYSLFCVSGISLWRFHDVL